MDIREMIDGGGQHPGEAWAKLWPIVQAAALDPIRRVLRARGEDPALAGDVIHELYVYLQADDLRRLRCFRGTTEAQFGSFVQIIAVRFTVKRLRQWHAQRKAERLDPDGPEDHSGPDVLQIWAALQELISIGDAADLPKLRAILREQGLSEEFPPGEELDFSAHPARTRRLWRQQMAEKYGRRII